LVKVEASGNGGQAITANVTNITWSNETVDNYNAWNGTTFTAPKDSWYLVNGSANNAGVSNWVVESYVNGVLFKSVGEQLSEKTGRLTLAGIFKLNKDDQLTFRATASITLSNISERHYISITELPDTESIIKNLSTQKTKCQTKFLQSNIVATGYLSELQFDNLTLGKTYNIRLHHSSSWTSTGVSLSRIILEDSSVSEISRSGIGGQHNSGNQVQNIGIDVDWVATTGTVKFNLSALTAANVLGNGTGAHTFATLCELPDTYVETDEW